MHNLVSSRSPEGGPSPALGNGSSRQVAAEEWRARVDLAAVYRLCAHYQWTDSIYTHISMRAPGERAFLMNPFGYMFDEVTASSLVKINFDGKILHDPVGLGFNWAGFIIHGAILASRPDVMCVIHTHTRAGAGVSAQKAGLLPLSQQAAGFMGRLGYHYFEGTALNKDEQQRFVRDLGPYYAMILRNHGLVTAGRSAGEAFCLMYALERACEVQIAALSGGVEVEQITQQAIDECVGAMDRANGAFNRDWTAFLRLADKIAPDFRT